MLAEEGVRMSRPTDKRFLPRILFVFLLVSLILVTSVPSVRAQSSESTWIITTLDNVGDVGQYCSLEVTPDGSYNIAYLDASNGHLKFATNSTGMANTTVLDDSSQSGYWTSIDKDLNGKLHIAYTTATGEDLYYLNNMNGAWVRQIAKTDYRCFAATSISDDGEGHVYITFHSSIYDDMYYVCNANPPDRWSHHDFYSNANVGEYCSFAMDAAKNTYTSFYDATNRDLLYNFNLVTNNVTIVDSEGDVGQYTSIGIDGGAQPRPFISYYDVTNGNLKMAYKQEPNATSWNRYVIDSFGDVGRFSSIGVEADATVHMAYYDASNQDLKYAVWKDGVSTCMTVDSRGNVGQYASIDIDAEGRPSIAYYDASNGDLKLATLTDQAPTQPGQYVPNAPADLATTLESNNSVRLRLSLIHI